MKYLIVIKIRLSNFVSILIKTSIPSIIRYDEFINMIVLANEILKTNNVIWNINKFVWDAFIELFHKC